MPYNSDCPSWLCNEWGVPHDIYYFLGFLALVSPYALIWQRFFKVANIAKGKALGFWGMLLLTEITLLFYLLIFVAMAMAFEWHFFFAMCYGPILVIGLLLLPTIIITILVAIFSSKKDGLEEKTNSDNQDLNT